MDDCDLCHELAETGGSLCSRCREDKAYWDSLTPFERRQEQESMDRYADEAED